LKTQANGAGGLRTPANDWFIDSFDAADLRDAKSPLEMSRQRLSERGRLAYIQTCMALLANGLD